MTSTSPDIGQSTREARTGREDRDQRGNKWWTLVAVCLGTFMLLLDGIPEVLKTERMGHEMPGMHGVYGHVSPAMRADLKATLQERWEISLRERTQLNPRSIVPTLDRLLRAQREASVKMADSLLAKSESAG
jgi:hypothetical protein